MRHLCNSYKKKELRPKMTHKKTRANFRDPPGSRLPPRPSILALDPGHFWSDQRPQTMRTRPESNPLFAINQARGLLQVILFHTLNIWHFYKSCRLTHAHLQEIF